MKTKANKPDHVNMQQAIQEAKKEIKHIVDAESDSTLRSILNERIELSISNIADKIEKNLLEGSIINQNDGSIDPTQTIVRTNLVECVKRALEKEKTRYLLHRQHIDNPKHSQVINANCFITLYSIRNEWNLWAIKRQLLADEAIPLMHGVDPTSWKEFKKGVKGVPDDMAHSIERCLEIANAKQVVIETPIDWLIWGAITIWISKLLNLVMVCTFLTYACFIYLNLLLTKSLKKIKLIQNL